MFEQPLYEYEPVAAPLRESDLFHNYEIKGWVSSPGLFKVLGLSAVVNIVALLVLAQTSLLTMKGCDSPLVGSVCQVLDTVYVGSLLFGTDREFVDVAYDRTELGEDEEITYIDVSNITPPLKYPAGYFEIANPEQAAMIEEQFGEPGFPGNPFVYDNPGFQGGFHNPPNGIPLSEPNGESLFNTPQHIPKPNPNVIDPDTLPGSSNSGGYIAPDPYKPNKPYKPKGKGNRPQLGRVNPEGAVAGNMEPNPNTEEHTPSPSPTPQSTVDPTAPVDAFNTRPLKVILVEVLGLLDKKQLDLQAPIDVKAGAKFGKDGKFAKDSFRAVTEGDKQLGTVVTNAIAALNDSNFLSLLKGVSGKDINFIVKQDQATVTAGIRSEMESDTRAQVIVSLVKSYLTNEITKKSEKITALETENDPSKAAELQSLRVDLELMKSIQLSNIGKEVIVGFGSPKSLVQQWLSTRLAEQRAEPKPDATTGGVPKGTADPAQK